MMALQYAITSPTASASMPQLSKTICSGDYCAKSCQQMAPKHKAISEVWAADVRKGNIWR
jgi:hypothetical protein